MERGAFALYGSTRFRHDHASLRLFPDPYSYALRIKNDSWEACC